MCRIVCKTCGGKGVTIMNQGVFIIQNVCGNCKGSKYPNVIGVNCLNCNGKGVISMNETFNIRIPIGAFSGQKISVRKDLIIEIIVEDDPVFKRDGNDLIFNVSLTFKESIVGKVIKIPHFDGEIIENTRGFGVINPNKKYAFKGIGIGLLGDLVLKFDIIYPECKYNEQLLEQFKLINF